jgi:flagellar hook-basal body complex protein FliE
MAGIGAVSGIRNAFPAAPTAASTSTRPAEGQTSGFGDLLKTYVDNVDAKQRASAQAVQDMVAGKTEDILPVVNQVAKADLSFKLLLGVRNKVIEAYRETMRMQI